VTGARGGFGGHRQRVETGENAELVLYSSQMLNGVVYNHLPIT